MTPNEIREVYLQACDAKGFQPNEGQLKIWRQVLGFYEKRDLEAAVVLWYTRNSDFPMPGGEKGIKPYVEQARRERLARSSDKKTLVIYVCPSCQAIFSTYVDMGDQRPRLCMTRDNATGELHGCRVRLMETERIVA